MTVKQIVEITDHSLDGYNRLQQQYKDPPATLSIPSIGPGLFNGWRGLLNAFIVPAQEFETIANKMLNERGITTSEGVNLDRIGEIVGVDRAGNTDEVYVTLIVGQIAENNSDTTARDLLAIATILIGPDLRDLSIKEIFPAKAVLDFLAEVQFAITSANNAFTVQVDLGGGSPLLPVILPDGDYFPHELRDLASDLIAVAWGEPIVVDFTGSRQFQFNIDTVPVLVDPAINWGTAGPLYGFTDGQTISVTTSGTPIAGPEFNSQSLADALDSAKAAGVGIDAEAVSLGNYFGFSNDGESLGFGALVDLPPEVVIGGGTYSTLI